MARPQNPDASAAEDATQDTIGRSQERARDEDFDSDREQHTTSTSAPKKVAFARTKARRSSYRLSTENDPDEGNKEYSFSGNPRLSGGQRLSSARYDYVLANVGLAHRQEEEDDALVDYLVLHTLEEEDGKVAATILTENIIAQVSDAAELQQSVTNHPDEWWCAINKYTDMVTIAVDEMRTAESLVDQAEKASTQAWKDRADADQKITDFTDQIRGFSRKYDQAQEDVKILQANLSKARTAITRIRDERTVAKNEKLELERKLLEAEHLNQELLSKATARTQRDVFDDSEEDEPHMMSGGRSGVPPPSSDRARSERPSPHPSLGTTTTTSAISDARHPHIESFAASSDDDVDRWIASARTRFKRAFALYPDKESKIEYIRDKLKGEAFEVARYRLMEEDNPYHSVDEIFTDLKDAFGAGKTDKRQEAMNDVMKGTYRQKPDESISLWSSRFATRCAQAGFDDNMRMFWALQMINDKFRSVAANNGQEDETWAEFVQRLRNVERKRAITKQEKEKVPSSEPKKKDTRPNTGRSTTTTTTTTGSTLTTRAPPCGRTPEQFDQLKRVGACARCLRKGHMFTDLKAPCREHKPTSFHKFQELIKLAAVRVDESTDTAEDGQGQREQGNE